MKIWEAKLDDRYDVVVERTGEYTGKLELRDGDRLIKVTDVPLAYGAKFGPDVDDVQQWQDWAVGVIDSLTKGNEL